MLGALPEDAPVSKLLASATPAATGRRVRVGLLLGLCLALAAASGTHKLRVGTSGDYPPFSVQDRNGETTGFDLSLARAYAEERGQTLELVTFRWPQLLEGLSRDRFDVAMSGITVTPERSVAGRFSVPVVETGAVAVVREPGRFADLDALDTRSVRIGVNAGGHLEQVARKRFPHASLIAIPQNDAVLTALLSASVDAVVSEQVEAALWTDQLKGSAVYGPFTRDRKAYLLAADRADLAADLDAWLLAREADGTLAALRQAELAGAAPQATATPLAALLGAVDERLALMPTLALAKRDQGLPLEAPKREAVVLDAAAAEAAAAAKRARRPPLPEAAVRGFYRAQIEAAKHVQRAAIVDADLELPGPLPDVEAELRPALLRIDARVARLLLMLPPDLAVETVRAAARDGLRAPYLDEAHVLTLADAIATVSHALPPAKDRARDPDQDRVSRRAARPASTGITRQTP
jgi:cyclohexadienyl dehydratase